MSAGACVFLCAMFSVLGAIVGRIWSNHKRHKEWDWPQCPWPHCTNRLPAMGLMESRGIAIPEQCDVCGRWVKYNVGGRCSEEQYFRVTGPEVRT